MNQKRISLGNHILADLYQCNREIISNQKSVQMTLLESARIANATVVADVFHSFNPQGISGVVVIAESHIAIHCWPEYACVSVDIFTCNEKMNAQAALDYIAKSFESNQIVMKAIKRGEQLEVL